MSKGVNQGSGVELVGTVVMTAADCQHFKSNGSVPDHVRCFRDVLETDPNGTEAFKELMRRLAELALTDNRFGIQDIAMSVYTADQLGFVLQFDFE